MARAAAPTDECRRLAMNGDEWKREGCQNGRERNARTEEELTPLVRPARVLRKHFQRKRIININKY